MLALLLAVLLGGPSQRVVVGYLPDWRTAEVEPERLKGLTDIVWFGLELEADGSLKVDELIAAESALLAKVREVTNARLLVCVGGWNRSEGFATAAATEVSRQQLAAELLDYCHANGFAGVDFDWEHPADATELTNYAALLSTTKATFAKHDLLVTVAQAGWQDIGAAGYAAVDRVHLMSYDHAFPQATFTKAQEDVERLIAWGCPPDKIALGLPFYGRNAEGEAKSWRELFAAHGVGNILGGYATNGPETVRRKTRWAMERGLAGVMIWEVSQDAPPGPDSLLDAIRRAAHR